ncbi:hypothetical protein D3C76_1245020 [compost metagenome]
MQQRPVSQVEAALYTIGAGREGVSVRRLEGLEQRRIVNAGVVGLPLALLLGKAQAQRIVMGHERGQCTGQGLRLQRLARGEHQALVPVMRLRHGPLEEGLLDRCQGRCASDRRLLCNGAGHFAGDTGQTLDGLMLEHVLGRQGDTFATGTADHLQRNDRIAT